MGCAGSRVIPPTPEGTPARVVIAEGGFPIIANALELWKNPAMFAQKGLELSGHKVFLFEAVQGVKESEMLIISGADAIHEFYHSPAITRSDPMKPFLDMLGGGTTDFVAYLDGEAHRKRKEVVLKVAQNVPVFDRYLPRVQEIIARHVQMWDQLENFKMFDRIEAMMIEISYDVIGGLEPEYIKSHPDFLKCLTYHMGIGFNTKVLPIPAGVYAKSLRCRDDLYKVMEESIKEHTKKPDLDTMVGQLVVAAKEAEAAGTPFGLDVQVRELSNLIFGAAAGEPAAMTYMAMTLAQYPDVKKKVAEEVKQLPQDRPLTCADLDKLVYTGQVVNEILRLYPYAVFLMGVAKDEWNLLGKYKIKAGTRIMAAAYSTNMDPDVYPDPDKFDADRFAPGKRQMDKSAHPACAFVAQGGAEPTNHRCAGELFVMNLTKLLAVKLVQYQYELESNQNLEIDWDAFSPIPKSHVKVTGFNKLGHAPETPVPADLECLPQKDTGDRVLQRDKEIATRHKKFEYEYEYPDRMVLIDSIYKEAGQRANVPLPCYQKDSSFEETSKDLRFSPSEVVTFMIGKAAMPVNAALGNFADWMMGIQDSMQEFTEHMEKVKSQRGESSDFIKFLDRLYTQNRFTLFSRPTPVNHLWIADDEEYARQRLGSISPMVIERCSSLEGFRPMPSDLKAELEAAIATKTLFVCDYRYLKVCTFIEIGRYLATDAVSFFKVIQKGNHKILVPVGINLGTDGVWFTPKDPLPAWLLAKMHAQCADAHAHQFTSHLGRAHIIIEPIMLASERNLDSFHPIGILLGAHWRGLLSINHIARISMLCQGDMIDQVMSSGRVGGYQIISDAYTKMKLIETFQEGLKRRGVDKESLPVNFPYRDDATAVDTVMRDFFKEIVDIFYKTDDDVVQDPQLQAFVAEVNEKCGLSQAQPFPEVKTRKVLADLVANIIFVCTLQHSLLNYGQFDFYSFAPNAPSMMKLPPPQTKEECTEELIIASLPGAKEALGVIGVAHILSSPSKDTLMTNPPKKLYKFKNPEAHAAVMRYQSRLEEATEKVRQNSKDRIKAFMEHYPDATDVPKSVEFPYCDPWVLATSIQI